MPAQSKSHIAIQIFDDYKPELDETFTVVFEEDSDDPQYRWTSTVTIKDDDPERIPNVALDVDERIVIVTTTTSNYFGRLVEIPEDTPSGTVSIPVELSAATGRTAVFVDYATQDGTAIAGEDYTETRGTLTFQPGQTRRHLSVPIIDDAINETNEFFSVVLSNPTNSVLLPRTVKVQILDNDEPAPDPPVNVNNGGAVVPIITPFPSRNGGSTSSSLMFKTTSLSLSESGSATYQVRATSSRGIEDTIVNIETTHPGITINPSKADVHTIHLANLPNRDRDGVFGCRRH